MPAAQMHREDVKAELRKRFGSIWAFENARGLPRNSVSDVLRGRSVRDTAAAIADELNKDVSEILPVIAADEAGQSDLSDDGKGERAACPPRGGVRL